MGRKVYTFSLNEQDDRQIIRWLDRLPKGEKSGAIKEALGRHIMSGAGVTLGDVYQAVKELDRKLQSGAGLTRQIVPDGGPPSDEPPDIAANLDKLGL